MKSETSVEIQDFIEKAEENSPKKLSMSLPVSLNFASPVVRYVLSCISKFDSVTDLRSLFSAFISHYSVESIKRTGCNKRTGWSKNFI